MDEKSKTILGGVYEGERALFMLKDAYIEGAVFQNGESPLKESQNLSLENVTFKWKYPIWYSHNIYCHNVTLVFEARSGIWYTNYIKMSKCLIAAQKTFRRSSFIELEDCDLPNASETFWCCQNIKLNNVKVNGDYFAMNSENIEVDNMILDGNYLFDGAKNIIIKNSILNSKDAFWNVKNATVINCKIIGEYLGWNSKNITFINCEISSLQGLCYMDNVKLVNCKMLDSTLTFEYCTRIDADIIDVIPSVKNPVSGTIKAKGIEELIINENKRTSEEPLEIIYK